MEYVAGFMFNKEKTKVALIRKIRPEWQNGFLNGIGGKVEPGECSIDAMCREFEEETSLKTFYYDWKKLIELHGNKDEWCVTFYFSDTLLDDFEKLVSVTDEKIEIIDVSNIDNEKIIPNLSWLIKMCFDEQIHGGGVRYNKNL